MPDDHDTQAIWSTYAVHSNLVVKGFFGPYRWLSNFHITPITYEGVTYPSVENAFQAAKTLERQARLEFVTVTPSKSKQMGREVNLRADWEQVKLLVMRDLITQKFDNDRNLFSALVTSPDHLEETNHWNDKFWGVCSKTGEGENHLGKLLMEYKRYRAPDLK